MLSFEQLPQTISSLTQEIISLKGDINSLKQYLTPAVNEILDINEAAEFLRCKVTTIEKLVRNGQLCSSKKLKKHLFFRADLIDFVKSGDINRSNLLFMESVLKKRGGKI